MGQFITKSDTNSVIATSAIGQEVFNRGNAKVYPTNGAFTVPDGISRIKVTCIGAGGNGGTGAGSSKACGGGGGGGEGAP